MTGARERRLEWTGREERGECIVRGRDSMEKGVARVRKWLAKQS